MSIRLFKSKSNWQAAPGWDTFDFLESSIVLFLNMSRQNLKLLLNLCVIIAKVKIYEIDGAKRI